MRETQEVWGSSGGAPFCYALTLHKINIFSGLTQLERPGAGRRSSVLTRVRGWFLGRVPHLSKSALQGFWPWRVLFDGRVNCDVNDILASGRFYPYVFYYGESCEVLPDATENL